MVTFHSYLSDRTHFVKINWTSSDRHTFQLGVPQESPFGRLLTASLCKILISSFAHKMDFAQNFSVDFF